MLQLSVLRRERISPHFVSLTVGGDDVRHLERAGCDQAGRFFIPAPGQGPGHTVFPSSERWMLWYTLQPAARRPRVRTYTVRRFRPDFSAFDLEIAVHADAPDAPTAPGANWALTAEPGDKLTFLDGGHHYAPVPGATWQLLVGDESALPAILSILEHSADTLPAHVFLEVPHDDDVRRDHIVPATTTMHWLPRDDPSTKPGTLARRALSIAQLPDGPFYTWAAGESSLANGIRRHLVNDRNVTRSHITARGYWRHGTASL
ncbi:siderophore-interacting protein [Streptomyces sp. 11-1-2]|uniref:siderophore-interacting protein n=1 Tax=unclassified Streptomyces TaxID=2593676 RepID=UPI000B8D47F2|nr:siderophore-interacting protein [Streptomyces sp. 11-1-2]ASQ99555.1 hypothetical protein CGL27_46910 [Streptomyces sp. 11-1-2]